MNLDEIEIRVLGALLEKQRVTPDAYPLTLNGLRAACNQATARDPVLDLDEHSIRAALQSLGRRRYTRLASGAGSRAAKYRHLLDEALGIDAGQQALLAVLMLRGSQTPGELRQRTERLHSFRDAESLHATLSILIDRGLAERLPRRPGQKEERYAHRLAAASGAATVGTGSGPSGSGAPIPAEHAAMATTDTDVADGHGVDGAGASVGKSAEASLPGQLSRTVQVAHPQTGSAPAPRPDTDPAVEARVSALEAQVIELKNELRELRDALGE